MAAELYTARADQFFAVQYDGNNVAELQAALDDVTAGGLPGFTAAGGSGGPAMIVELTNPSMPRIVMPGDWLTLSVAWPPFPPTVRTTLEIERRYIPGDGGQPLPTPDPEPERT